VWVNRDTPAGRGLPTNNPSVAATPIVAALPADSAADLGWPRRWPTFDALLPAPGRLAGPVRFAFGDPDRSTPTVGVLLGLESAAATRRDTRAALATVLRAATPTTEPTDRVLQSLRPGVRIAVPATEQQVWARNGGPPTDRAVAVYPARAATVAD
jgi:hypothetical protein